MTLVQIELKLSQTVLESPIPFTIPLTVKLTTPTQMYIIKFFYTNIPT